MLIKAGADLNAKSGTGKTTTDLRLPAPRLVYADWLREQGNGWGEVIVASLRKPVDEEALGKLCAGWCGCSNKACHKKTRSSNSASNGLKALNQATLVSVSSVGVTSFCLCLPLEETNRGKRYETSRMASSAYAA